MNWNDEAERIFRDLIVSLKGQNAEEAAAYARERARSLARALAAADPGYPEALQAAAHSIALKAGLEATEGGRTTDQAILQAVLRMAAAGIALV